MFHIIDTLCFKLKKFHNRPQNKLIGQKVIILYREQIRGNIKILVVVGIPSRFNTVINKAKFCYCNVDVSG